MDIEIEVKREQIRQQTILIINGFEEDARVKIELVRLTVIVHIENETNNLWYWADGEIQIVREEVHLYVQHTSISLRAEGEERIIALRIEIDFSVDAAIEIMRRDALLKIEAYKIKIIAEIDGVNAEFLFSYQNQIVIETQIAIETIETYYINIYVTTETRIIHDHTVRLEELHIYWLNRLEYDTTDIINNYNIMIADITYQYEILFVEAQLKWQIDLEVLIENLRLDFEGKITQYRIDLDVQIRLEFGYLDDWYVLVMGDERNRITILIEQEINILNINYQETLRLKTEHFLILIQTEIERLTVNANIEIHNFTITITETTWITCEGLRMDAERQVAEFVLQIQVQIELEIHQLTVWWTNYYADQELIIIHHWTSLIADLEDNGQAEIDRETIRIQQWVITIITELNYQGGVSI